jgi:hypothetical protein
MKIVKQLIAVLFCIVTIGLGTGCKKESQHYVRVKNSYYEDVDALKLDAINFGTVKKGTKTDYKSVLEGTFPVSGSTASGSKLQGDITIKGDGTHHWTMTIMTTGGVSFNEDK